MDSFLCTEKRSFFANPCQIFEIFEQSGFSYFLQLDQTEFDEFDNKYIYG